MSDLSFEISQEEFSALPENDRLLIDIRDQASISYGMIPGALHVLQENVPEWVDTPKASFSTAPEVFSVWSLPQSFRSAG